MFHLVPCFHLCFLLIEKRKKKCGLIHTKLFGSHGNHVADEKLIPTTANFLRDGIEGFNELIFVGVFGVKLRTNPLVCSVAIASTCLKAVCIHVLILVFLLLSHLDLRQMIMIFCVF